METTTFQLCLHLLHIVYVCVCVCEGHLSSMHVKRLCKLIHPSSFPHSDRERESVPISAASDTIKRKIPPQLPGGFITA